MICCANQQIGIGHLSRLLALAQALSQYKGVSPEFLIFGAIPKTRELSNFNVNTPPPNLSIYKTIESFIESGDFSVLIFDLHIECGYEKCDLNKLFLKAKSAGVSLVGIDSLIEYCHILDIVWMPSFDFDFGPYQDCSSMLESGWDSFLIQKRTQGRKWSHGNRVLILTGGSDAANLGRVLPCQLDRMLDSNIELHWVKGPFSGDLILPEVPRLKWSIHDSPEYLDDLIVQSNYVVTVFGVSFFEVLQYGIPSVVFSPYAEKDFDELKKLSKEKVAMVVHDLEFVVDSLITLILSDDLAKSYSVNALRKMSVNGSQRLAKKIYLLLCKNE